MRGPFLLRPLQVDMYVPVRVGGVYCLGKSPKQVLVVGRSERDLRDMVKSFWNEYNFFWYEPAISARECYVRHCLHYHRYTNNGGLSEEEHPVAPPDSQEKCPVCGK